MVYCEQLSSQVYTLFTHKMYTLIQLVNASAIYVVFMEKKGLIMKLSNIKISYQVILLAGLNLLLLGFLSLYVVLNLSKIANELKAVADEDLPLTKIVSEISEMQLSQGRQFEIMLRQAVLMNTDTNQKKEFEKSVDKFLSISKEVDSEIQHGKQKIREVIEKHQLAGETGTAILSEFMKLEKSLIKIEKEYTDFENHVVEAIQKLKQGQYAEVMLKVGDLEHEEVELEQHIEELHIELEKFTQDSLVEAELHEENVLRAVIILSLICLIISIVFATIIIRNISQPLKALSKTLWEVAQGNLSSRSGIKSKNELGTIAMSIDDFASELQTVINELDMTLTAVAKGDLTKPITIDFKGDLGQIKSSVNSSIELLSTTVSQIADGSEQVSISAVQLSDSAQSLASGASEQAASLEETSSSITEVESQTKSNSDNATQAQQLTNQTLETVDNSNRQMEEMLSSMGEIQQTSVDVNKIIKVIDEIAFQTNLLALNAAVEAARAGKYGKGFAVVAEEVRSLAARSADAAKNTTELIENSVKQVENGVANADKTAAMLKGVSEAVVKINDTVNEIAAASNEQAKGIAEINLGINQVNKVVQENSSISEETASASEELSAQAEQMRMQVKQFKLSEKLTQTGAGSERIEMDNGFVKDKKATSPIADPSEETVSIKGSHKRNESGSPKTITLDSEEYGRF